MLKPWKCPGKDFSAAALKAERIIVCSPNTSEVSPRKISQQALPVLLGRINYRGAWNLLLKKATGFHCSCTEYLASVSTFQLFRTLKLGNLAMLWWLFLADMLWNHFESYFYPSMSEERQEWGNYIPQRSLRLPKRTHGFNLSFTRRDPKKMEMGLSFSYSRPKLGLGPEKYNESHCAGERMKKQTWMMGSL